MPAKGDGNVMESATRVSPNRLPSPDCFSKIVGPMLELMANVASKILKSDDMAEDAAQEAALSLWLEDDWPPNPRAWLLQAFFHRSLHLARTQARRSKHESRACLERPEVCVRDDPSPLLESQDLCRKLFETLEMLRPVHREILILGVFEEWDYASIAKILQIPVGTVRSRLNRSRLLFRKSVERFL